MISLKDFYSVLANVVPLYVAMILAYGSVKWWKIITPQQCSGINKFVSFFAVPFFSFKFISNNNPFAMNWPFILADTLQKLIVLVVLFLWCKFSSRSSLEWSITLFSLSTLPNTLAMGVPLLTGMYGEFSGPLMVQIVVMQCIVWYTLLLFLYEFRAARLLISEKFPENAASITSFKVDSDVISLDLREQELETEAEIGEDGKIHVKLRKSTSVRSESFSKDYFDLYRLSNLTNAEIYSLQSSKRNSYINESDNIFSLMNNTPRISDVRSSSFGNFMFDEEKVRGGAPWVSSFGSQSLHGVQGGGSGPSGYPAPSTSGIFKPTVGPTSATIKEEGGSDLQVNVKNYDYYETDGPNVTNNPVVNEQEIEGPMLPKLGSKSATKVQPENAAQCEPKPTTRPPLRVMTKLILTMVWRKLIRNPNTYASVIGLVWSLISCRFHIKMPAIVANSIKIMSDTGLGMAMFSLGLFMALQPRIIAGGNKMALYAAVVRFIVGPLVTAAASTIVKLRGTILRISIVQASLPLGILPFVFAKEFNIHPEILSTAVIFGLLIALPITIVYYIVLGLIK